MPSGIVSGALDFGYDMAEMQYGADLQRGTVARSADINRNEQIRQMRENPLNMTEGFKTAGFSPLSALGSFSGNATLGSNVGSAPSSSHKTTPSDSVAGLKKANPEVQNINASTRVLGEKENTEREQQKKLAAEANKADVEAEGIAIDNANKENRDNSVDASFKANMDSWINEAEQSGQKEYAATLRALKDETGHFNSGNIEGLSRFWNMSREKQENRLAEEIAKAKIAHKVPESLAQMPEKELQQLTNLVIKIDAETANIREETKLASQKTNESKQNVEESKQRVEESKQAVKKMMQEVKSLYHNDPVELWNTSKHDYFVYMGSQVGKDVSHGIGQGVGYGLSQAATKGKGAAGAAGAKGLKDIPKEESPKSSGKARSLQEITDAVNKNAAKKKAEWQRKQAEENAKRMKRIRSGFPDTEELKQNAGAW